MERFTFNNVDGRYCIVMTGAGVNDHRVIRYRLSLSRIKWTDDSDELCLELLDPTVTQVMSTRQLCKELNRSKIDATC